LDTLNYVRDTVNICHVTHHVSCEIVHNVDIFLNYQLTFTSGDHDYPPDVARQGARMAIRPFDEYRVAVYTLSLNAVSVRPELATELNRIQGIGTGSKEESKWQSKC